METHPGPRMRGNRTAIGLTLSETSYKAHIDIARLSRFERGVADLTAEQDARLQRVLADALAVHRKELDLVLAQDRAVVVHEAQEF